MLHAIRMAIKARGLSDAEFRLLVTLANYANADGFAWPSMATLARDLEKSERAVRAVLRRLEERGLVETVLRPGQSSMFRLRLEALEAGVPGGGNGLPGYPGTPEESFRPSPTPEESFRGTPEENFRPYGMTPEESFRGGGRILPGGAEESFRYPGRNLPVEPNKEPSNEPVKEPLTLPPYNPPQNLENRGEEREGKEGKPGEEEKENPKNQTPLPGYPNNDTSNQSPALVPSFSTPGGDDLVRALEALRARAPWLARILAASPGRLHANLPKAEAILEFYGEEVARELWDWAKAHADYSPLGAFLRFADPSVPLPDPIRKRLAERQAPEPEPEIETAASLDPEELMSETEYMLLQARQNYARDVASVAPAIREVLEVYDRGELSAEEAWERVQALQNLRFGLWEMTPILYSLEGLRKSMRYWLEKFGHLFGGRLPEDPEDWAAIFDEFMRVIGEKTLPAYWTREGLRRVVVDGLRPNVEWRYTPSGQGVFRGVA